MKTTYLLGSLLAVACGAAHALAIQSVTTSPGLTTTVGNVCTVDFNSTASLSGCANATYSAGTGAHIVSGSMGGLYAQPANDPTPYLTVDPALGPVTISLATGADYFGFYAGSIDTYNSLTFTPASGPALTLTGTQIAALLSGPANGSENSYFNFFTDALFTSVTLSSTGYAFETDNHSFGIASVPEPGAIALLGIGALALGIGKRRRAK